MHLATGWFGSVLVDDGAIAASRPFPGDATAVADRLERLAAGEVLDEERALAAQAGGAFTVHERRLADLAGAERGPAVEVHAMAQRLDVPSELYKAALTELARRRIRDGLADPDRHVMEAVNALDEVNDTLNLLGERLEYWLGLIAPEATDAAKDPPALARALVETRDAAKLAELLGADASDPLGAAPGPGEVDAAHSIAKTLISTQATRARIEAYLDHAVRELAPNVCAIVGPKIGGQLIKHAGGVARLARKPASTIQTLGAETALFRHITTGGPPPKHGVIYKHPLIHRAHPRDRGSIARALAGKIAIAARADAITGRDIGDQLRAQVEARAARVRRASR